MSSLFTSFHHPYLNFLSSLSPSITVHPSLSPSLSSLSSSTLLPSSHACLSSFPHSSYQYLYLCHLCTHPLIIIPILVILILVFVILINFFHYPQSYNFSCYNAPNSSYLPHVVVNISIIIIINCNIHISKLPKFYSKTLIFLKPRSF